MNARRMVEGKRVTVVGAGKSGIAAAALLARHGARVFVSEASSVRTDALTFLVQAGIELEQGGHTDRVSAADYAVLSPGVPRNSAVVRTLEEARVPAFGELELASWFCQSPIVAITGTNGKTTTTSLTGHILRSSGRRTWVAGNIGAPFSTVADTTERDDVVVLEVSSFQLDSIDRFRPDVAVLLNITPDHLDRYENDFDLYARSKCRIYENQKRGDVLVYNHDDEEVRDRVSSSSRDSGVHAIGFSQKDELDEGAFIRGGRITLRFNNKEEQLMRASELALPGRHNLYNTLAAAVASRAMEVRSDVIRQSLVSFEGVPHRLELVRDVRGVRFVNDSKATNVNAVWYALESFDCPIVLIAGGRDKGNDYKVLEDLVREKVRAVVALGESRANVVSQLGDMVQTSQASTLDEAVRAAFEFAEPGDVVLLSPACSSFDMFDNFEHRGEEFRREVEQLVG